MEAQNSEVKTGTLPSQVLKTEQGVPEEDGWNEGSSQSVMDIWKTRQSGVVPWSDHVISSRFAIDHVTFPSFSL